MVVTVCVARRELPLRCSDTVGRQHLRLTIERQMPMILGIDHMRDEPLCRQPTPNQSFRRGALENDAMTGAAGQFGSAGDDYAILRQERFSAIQTIRATWGILRAYVKIGVKLDRVAEAVGIEMGG
jgi:hypothetical protein